MTIAVVMPTLDEEAELGATLDGLLRLPPEPLEVVVSDGGSRDDTRRVAEAAGVRVVSAARGRGAQLNAGARATAAEVIVFLHADTRFEREHLLAVRRALADPAVIGGSFPIRLDATGAFYRLTERVANLRTRLDRELYGDQAMFCRRSAFLATGGFPEVPILEDLLFGRRLRSHGRLLFPAGPPVLTSARRWQNEGRLRTLYRNSSTRLLFALGASLESLRERYDRQRGARL